MKKKLLFIVYLSLSLSLFAQQTHNIEWGFGSNPSATGDFNTDRTIAPGDTVVWNWYGDGSHNVVSIAGGTETFNSGGTINSTTHTFSYTFNTVGTTSFRCSPHASMNGTITVQTLSNPEFDVPAKFSIYPNPSSDVMNINIPTLTDEGLKLEVFDVLGKKVYTQQLNSLSSKVNIAKWNSGLYLVRLTSPDEDITLTKRFVKL
ncbi:T9SS type A sorting domain-containing protein [Lacinutrix chionoecetis]